MPRTCKDSQVKHIKGSEREFLVGESLAVKLTQKSNIRFKKTAKSSKDTNKMHVNLIILS
jgi:hypothetical protein